MRITSHIAIACTASALLAGCAKRDQAAQDTAAVAAMPAPAPAAAPAPAPTPAFNMSAVAGKWRVRSVPETGKDTTPTNYVLTATADTAGWFITFPSGVKVPLHVTVSGDSVMQKTGAFPSQRRKGAKVMTESTMRMQDGKLVGTTVAHYMNAGADSVLRLRSEGSKAP